MNESVQRMYVEEPAKRVPVLYDVDVVVAGSGIAGSMAAIAAGRHGARTVVVDRFGQLGGNMGPGLWGGGTLHLSLTKGEKDDLADLVCRNGMGGIPDEFHRRAVFARPNADAITDDQRRELEEAHMNVPDLRLGTGGGLSGYIVDSFVASHVLLEMMDEAGVETLTSAYAADPIMEGRTVKGLYVETKSGRVAVKAKVVIDATGQADVACRAGAAVINITRPNLGLYFALNRVDAEKYFRFRDANAEADPADLEWAKRTFTSEKNEADPYACPPHMLKAARKAYEAGEFEFARKVGTCVISLVLKDDHFRDGLAAGRTGTVGEIDFADAKGVALMEREHREHVYRFATFARNYIPGFEDSYLLLTSPFLGARGGRYLQGIRPITGDDVRAGRRFDDAIYPFSNGSAKDSCDVPYRSLVPKETDGLLAAGRSAFVYGPNFRSRYSAMLNGQAAGVAAAICAKDNVQPRNLDIKKLQKALLALRCPLGTPERLKELGLA
ncbi:MAG: FAD-dependent oxidoreductase [Phycisphaerae bacterium]|nr:FAD-dependent oxidoreductase [Phycisphaerae bacterium]